MLSIFTTHCHEHFTEPFGNLNIYKLKLFLQAKNPQVARVIISTWNVTTTTKRNVTTPKLPFIYYLPFVRALHVLLLIFTTPLQGRYWHYHLTDKKTEAERHRLMGLRSHSPQGQTSTSPPLLYSPLFGTIQKVLLHPFSHQLHETGLSSPDRWSN